MRIAIAVAALLLPLSARASSPGEPAALVQKVLAAYGGRAALERARVVRERGTVTSIMRQGSGRLVRIFQRPASLRVEVAFPGQPPEVRILHDAYGDRGGVEVTGTVMHRAMVLQAARLALPLSLAAKDARLSDRGAIERDGKRLRVLALQLPDGLEVTAAIDPASGRIVRSAGSLPGPGGRIEFATDYSDFRKVSGVLFAFHEENWARGQHTGATVLEEVEILDAVPAGTFTESL
jgi:hypothetical protein